MSRGEAVVWIGSYGEPSMQDKSYECVRWTATAAMQAMQDFHSKHGGGQLQFEEHPLPPEETGYAPGHDRWEADISCYMADGRWCNQFVYVEPFLIPAEGSERETKWAVITTLDT